MTKFKFIAIFLALLFIAGCKDSRVDDLLSKISDLEKSIDEAEKSGIIPPNIYQIVATEGKNQHVGDNRLITVPYWKYVVRIEMNKTQPSEISTKDSWITLAKDGEDFIAEFDINEGAQRTGTITINNAANPEKSVILSVNQFKNSPSILTRWAKLNIGELNKFSNGKVTDADAIQEEQVSYDGTKFYQYGRNQAFDYLNYSADAINNNNFKLPSDAKDESRFIKGAYFGEFTDNWYQGGDGKDTWVSVANAVGNGTVEGTHRIGNNGGDPSPEGYRLPTKAEFATLFKMNKSDPLNYGQRVDIEEDLCPGFDGVVKTYKTDYRLSSKGYFALKMKGSEFAEAIMYQFVKGTDGSPSYMKITAKRVSMLTIIDDIAKAEFFNDTDPALYFPYVGKISSDGRSTDRDRNGYYNSGVLDEKLIIGVQMNQGGIPAPNEYSVDTHRVLAYPLRCVRK